MPHSCTYLSHPGGGKEKQHSHSKTNLHTAPWPDTLSLKIALGVILISDSPTATCFLTYTDIWSILLRTCIVSEWSPSPIASDHLASSRTIVQPQLNSGAPS
ncbi:hypothetical protein GOODEAATRI_013041 [Goodea atripinnis]|uniref:Uncharacterized protein n=1 Tax=Goodea atripinnis TaxID=208336 RepID=A0ABV0PXM7_9TELE